MRKPIRKPMPCHACLALVAGLAAGLPGAASAQPSAAAQPQRAGETRTTRLAPDVMLETRVADPLMLQASREFDTLDRNGDGLLDRDEAGDALATDFDRVDSDGDRRIDRDEYTARLRR